MCNSVPAGGPGIAPRVTPGESTSWSKVAGTAHCRIMQRQQSGNRQRPQRGIGAPRNEYCGCNQDRENRQGRHSVDTCNHEKGCRQQVSAKCAGRCFIYFSAIAGRTEQ